ncbi:MAG: protease modulator HflK [Lentisphaeria bacterium]|jgi:membrane protease subunit HflK|nr:protease modulator HflK [Lentisphaeria bacterium]
MATTPVDNTHDNEIGEGAAALVKTTKLMIVMLRIAIAVLLIAYILSGFFYVEPTEYALVLRFGKISGTAGEEIVESGSWQWTWPKPIGEVVRIPKKTQSLSTDYFYFNDEYLGGPESKPVLSDSAGPLVTGTDGYLLTKDENILHAKWGLTYDIVDPVIFYTSQVDADATIRRIFESTILKRIARTAIDQALYADPDDLRKKVKRDTLKAFEKLNIGIKVKFVNFGESTPPRSSVLAFYEVQKSEHVKQTLILEAETYRNTTTQSAKGLAKRRQAEAEAYASELVSSVQAEAQYFNQLLEQYQKKPDIAIRNLISITRQHVMQDAEKILLPASPGEIRIRLNRVKPTVTDDTTTAAAAAAAAAGSSGHRPH